MSSNKEKDFKWYQGGLAFSCQQCGNCCSGPASGYVWVTLEDIDNIANYRNEPVEDFKRKYVRKIGRRYSLIEKKPSHDCVFLEKKDGKIGCSIYSHRPIQCRTWPFWPELLKSPDHWNNAATGCPGINRGKLYPVEMITAVRAGKSETTSTPIDPCHSALHWIGQNIDDQECFLAMDAIMQAVEEKVSSQGGICKNSGNCCNFDTFGHKLYISTLEMLYFVRQLQNDQNITTLPKMPPPKAGSCSFMIDKLCTARHGRPSGCRIFFCSGATDKSQNTLTENTLAQIKKLHEKYYVPYHYCDWLHWLKQYDKLDLSSLYPKK
jgi:Fe-S-cluster containining protein